MKLVLAKVAIIIQVMVHLINGRSSNSNYQDSILNQLLPVTIITMVNLTVNLPTLLVPFYCQLLDLLASFVQVRLSLKSLINPSQE